MMTNAQGDVVQRPREEMEEFGEQCRRVCDVLQQEFKLNDVEDQLGFVMNFANLLVVSSFKCPEQVSPKVKEMMAGSYITSLLQTMAGALVMNFNEAHGTNLGYISMRDPREEN